MGLFNDTTTMDHFFINAYCIVSALFFATCGYAQLNDPNPVPWCITYLVGGVLPNLYWMTSSSGAGGGPGSTTTTTTTQNVSLLLHGYMASITVCILYKLITVSPKLFRDVTEQHYGYLWAFMEHEEGRDACGLLLLLLHVLYMNSMVTRPPTTRRRRGSSSSRRPAMTTTTETETDGTAVTATSTTVVSPALVSFLFLGMVGGAIYMWVVHHPDMVAKYGVPHCQGTMFGRDDNNEL